MRAPRSSVWGFCRSFLAVLLVAESFFGTQKTAFVHSQQAASQSASIGVGHLRQLAASGEWDQLHHFGARYADWLRLQEKSAAETDGSPSPATGAGMAKANVEALRIFGVAEYQRSDIRRAHLFLELAVNASGGFETASVDLLHDAGLIALTLRKRVGETYLRQALRQDPYHLPTILTLGSHLVGQGQTSEALRIYEIASAAGNGNNNNGIDAFQSSGGGGVASSMSFRINYALALNFAGLLEEMAVVLRGTGADGADGGGGGGGDGANSSRLHLMAATAVMPIVARSEGQIAFWREQSRAAVDAFRSTHAKTCAEYLMCDQDDKDDHTIAPTGSNHCRARIPKMKSVPEASLLASNIGYYLPYHALNNKALMVAYGQMYRCLAFEPVQPAAAALPEDDDDRLSPAASASFSVYDDLSPIKQAAQPSVMFVSGHLRNHTLGYLMHNLIEALPALGYHVHVVTCSKAMDGISTRLARAVTGERGLNSASGSYTILPCGDNEGHRTSEVLEAIRNVGPDAIVYNDVSMEGSSYLLAQYRLAPVQILTMNNGLTSGLPNMDFYVSSDLAEPDQGYRHYSEQVVRLPECMYACVDRPPIVGSPTSAIELAQWYDELGFDAQMRQAGSRIYLIPQTLFKLHPRFDSTIAQLLRADPFGFIVLPTGAQPVLAEQLLRRFQRTLGQKLASRIRFVPHMGSSTVPERRDHSPSSSSSSSSSETTFLSREKFMRLLRLAHVVLDPAPFGGGLTSLEAFSVGTPVVTLANEYRSGRLTMAMYSLMGLGRRTWKVGNSEPREDYFRCCVAYSQDEYVDMALVLAGARDELAAAVVRREVLDTIQQNYESLFRDRRAIEAWDTFLKRAISQWRNHKKNVSHVV